MKRRIFLLALALILALSLCACGQVYNSSYDEAAAAEPQMAYDGDVAFGVNASRKMATEEAIEAPAEAPVAGSGTSLADTEGSAFIPAPKPEKIIYTVDLSMETKEFDETIAAFEASVKKYGGYTMYSNVTGDSTYASDGTARVINRFANYSVSIPADKLEAFLAETTELGNVTSNSKSAENVTSRYADYQTRKASLETEETRLLELLAKGDNIEALVVLEKRLSEVRYEIESLQSQLSDMDRRIAYSTVNLNLQEVRDYKNSAPVTQSFGERLHDAFGDGWDNFVDGLEDFAVGLAEAIIPLALLAVIIIVVIGIVRKKVKKSRAAKPAKNPADKAAPADAPAEAPSDKPKE